MCSKYYLQMDDASSLYRQFTGNIKATQNNLHTYDRSTTENQYNKCFIRAGNVIPLR